MEAKKLVARMVELAGDGPDQQAFAKLLAETVALEESNTKVDTWFFIPDPVSLASMLARDATDQVCPKCGKGRVVVRVYHGNLGDSLWYVCKWGAKECDYKEGVPFDESRW